tara:strand:+ start:149 stop:367 length:219 start_codon:yes stop_codon:yes gene_type:complete
MSDRGEFLCQYAGRILGRELTADEAKLVSVETNRRVVRDLCGTFAKPKPKKPKVLKEKPDTKVTKEVAKDEE